MPVRAAKRAFVQPDQAERQQGDAKPGEKRRRLVKEQHSEKGNQHHPGATRHRIGEPQLTRAVSSGEQRKVGDMEHARDEHEGEHRAVESGIGDQDGCGIAKMITVARVSAQQNANWSALFLVSAFHPAWSAPAPTIMKRAPKPISSYRFVIESPVVPFPQPYATAYHLIRPVRGREDNGVGETNDEMLTQRKRSSRPGFRMGCSRYPPCYLRQWFICMSIIEMRENASSTLRSGRRQRNERRVERPQSAGADGGLRPLGRSRPRTHPGAPRRS